MMVTGDRLLFRYLLLVLLFTGIPVISDAMAKGERADVLDTDSKAWLSGIYRADLAPNWWLPGDYHDDRDVLGRELDWRYCIGKDGHSRPSSEQLLRSSDTVDLGLSLFWPRWIYVRDRGWRDFLAQREMDRKSLVDGFPQGKRLYFSVLPYVRVEGKRYWLVPRIDAVGRRFKQFSLTCSSEKSSNSRVFFRYPQYYSTAVLELSSRRQAIRFFERLVRDSGKEVAEMDLADTVNVPVGHLRQLTTLGDLVIRVMGSATEEGGFSYLRRLAGQVDDNPLLTVYGLPPPGYSHVTISVQRSPTEGAAAHGRGAVPIAAVRVERQTAAANIPLPAASQRHINVELPPKWRIPEVAGCSAKRWSGARLRCTIEPLVDSISLDWRNGWESVVIPTTSGRIGPDYLQAHLRPTWPFAGNDPGWVRDDGEPVAGQEGCEVLPRFRIQSLSYIVGDYEQIQPAGVSPFGRFPVLDHWDPNRPLPSKIRLVLHQDGDARRYLPRAEIVWEIAKGKEHSLLTNFSTQVQTDGLAVTISEPVSPLQYGNGYEVHFFPTPDACRRQATSNDFVYFWPDELEEIRLPPCVVAKVVERETQRSVSHCTRAVMDDERLRFDFRPRLCEGKRRLMVLSLSSSIDSAVRARRVRDLLRDYLIGLKQKGSRIPFDLVVVTARNRVDNLLSCEQLQELTEEEIGTAGRVRFSARDLDSADDLYVAFREVQSPNGLERVLYITASDNLDEDTLSQGLGLAYKWQRQDIPFHVITHRKCDLWRELAGVAECLQWNRTNDIAILEAQLDWLFQSVRTDDTKGNQ